MTPKELDAVNAENLDDLVANSVREGRTIEYKRSMPGNSDAEKKEFLADVSSFANAVGGDLVYGIDAIDGVPATIPGLPGMDEDKEKLRLESAIRDGLEPRIPGVQFKVVRRTASHPVLIIRIPKSWLAPHMMTYKGSSRFYSRSSAGKFQLDVSELRAAFSVTSDLPARIRRWRDERLGCIVADDAPVRLATKDRLILHLIPFESFVDEWRFKPSVLSDNWADFRPLNCSSWDHRINLDGYLTYSGTQNSRGLATSYVQIFRSGRIEATMTNLLDNNDGFKTLASIWYERELVNGIQSYLRGLSKLGVIPPIVALISIIGVRGAYLSAARRLGQEIHAIDRDPLILPDVLVEDFTTPPSQTLRPAFDAVWNSFGFSRSFNYDDDGNWNPRE